MRAPNDSIITHERNIVSSDNPSLRIVANRCFSFLARTISDTREDTQARSRFTNVSRAEFSRKSRDRETCLPKDLFLRPFTSKTLTHSRRPADVFELVR